MTLPCEYTVRLYVLEGQGLARKDDGGNGCSDPYLVVSLGSHVEDCREERLTNVDNADFFRYFELHTRLPGDAALRIDVFDYDGLGRFSDELIGSTTIDLEDRIFSDHWWSEYRDMPPIERRPLYAPTSSVEQVHAPHIACARQLTTLSPRRPSSSHTSTTCSPPPTLPCTFPQGHLKLWVEIHQRTDRKGRSLPPPPEPFDISPPAPQAWELRVICWQVDRSHRPSSCSVPRLVCPRAREHAIRSLETAGRDASPHPLPARRGATCPRTSMAQASPTSTSHASLTTGRGRLAGSRVTRICVRPMGKPRGTIDSSLTSN